MKRFFIMTIEGRKYVNPLLSLVSTGVYSLDCSDFNFFKLEVDGVVGSEKTSAVVSGDSLYTYFYNRSARTLQIRLNAVDLTNKKNFIVTHIITVTNGSELYFNIDPDSPNTREVVYESRVNQSPQFGQEQENNLNGVLTLSSSSIDLNNTDRNYNKFFTVNDSFKGCAVRAWKCNESVSSRVVVYIGTISKADIDDGTLKFSTEDILNRLDSVFYSKGTYESSIASSRAGVPDNQKLIPIRRIYGRNSAFKTKYESVTGEINQQVLDSETLPEAYCVNSNPTPSTSVNRVWETGILEDRIGMEDEYAVTSALVVGTGAGLNSMVLELAGLSYDDFTVGDTFNDPDTGEFGTVVDVASNGLTVSPYTLSGPSRILTNKVSALIVKSGGTNHYLKYGCDYTVIAPTGDNPLIINLFTNFEANVGMTSPIDPATDVMVYKIRNKSGRASYSHGAQAKKIILSEFSASEINSTSFDDADVALDLDLCFMVPDMGGSFPNKRDLVQKLIVSSFGYLYLGDDFKINYGNFRFPTPTEQLTDVEINKGSISHSIDYNDVYQSVRFISEEFTNVLTIKSDQANYLHKTNKVKDYDHCCDVVSINKPTAHFKKITQILSMKRIITQMGIFETPLRIGNERIINSPKKLGNSEGVILSLENTDKETTMRIAQLESAQGNMGYILNGTSMGNL